MKSVTESEPIGGSTAKPRVLVVDDEPLVGTMLRRLLSRSYDVTATTSGAEGLRLATEQQWDAILCDVMMPGLGGPDILRRLRRQKHPSAACIGFMTGGAFDTTTRAFLDQLGRRGWLPKPFGRQEVETFIEGLRAPQRDD